MIEIKNLQFALTGSTFDVEIDGQILTGCRTVDDRGRMRVVTPPAAANILWGEHSIPDIEAAVTEIIRI